MHLGTFLSDFDHFFTFKRQRRIWRRKFSFSSNNSLQPFSKPFPLLLGTLHMSSYCTCKCCITNASSKEEAIRFLISHYITATVGRYSGTLSIDAWIYWSFCIYLLSFLHLVESQAHFSIPSRDNCIGQHPESLMYFMPKWSCAEEPTAGNIAVS